MQETWVQSLGWEDPLENEQPLLTPVFWPGKFHEQGSLMGYRPWGCKESGTTEQLSISSEILYYYIHMCVLRSTLCDPMECSPPGSSIREFIPGKNTGVGCHFLLQGIFLTQVLNPFLLYLLHWQIFFYHWATWKSPLLYIPLVNILLFQFLQCNCYWWL